MKKTILITTLVLMLLLTACGPKAEATDPNAAFTEAAKTVFAQFTEEAANMPTNTPVPPTETLAPSATPAPPTPTLEPTIAPTQPWTFHPAGPVIAPVLLYNSVADDADDDPNYQWESNYFIPVKDFYTQMLILKESGYTAITANQLITAIKEGGDLPAKPVVITFDIGRMTIYTQAFPIMQEMGFVGTAFIPSNYLDGGGMLSTVQAKELLEAGWEIGSNGMNHTDLTTYQNLGDEISGSRLALNEKLDTEVKTFSYVGIPDGSITTRVIEWGYYGAVGLLRTTEHPAPYYVGRYEITSDLTMENFAAILPWQPRDLAAILAKVPGDPTATPTAQP